MIANVNEQLWVDFDLDTAMFLDTIAYWIKKNAANKQPRNFHEGRYWTYNTLDAYTKLFPGWSIQTIRRIIKNCLKHELLIVGNFNKKSYDRTGWYSLTDKAIEYYPNLSNILHNKPDNVDSDSFVGSNTPFVGTNTAIPKLLPSSNINTNITSENPNIESGDSLVSATENNSSDYLSNYTQGNNDACIAIEDTGLNTKSDYHNNQSKKCSYLLNIEPSNTKTSKRSKKSTVEGRAAHELLMSYIDVYRQEFPNNPQPHPRVIATSLQKTLQTLVKRWHELDPDGKPLTPDTFRRYLMALKSLAPKFSLGEYETTSGNRKKNGLETFARWNTVVKFLENQYS